MFMHDRNGLSEYSDINEANTSHQHSSMSLPRVKERLKLDDDCISAFSQSETLDEANPW